MSEPHRNVTPEVRLADSSRVEAFTDAVLAIVMTILDMGKERLSISRTWVLVGGQPTLSSPKTDAGKRTVPVPPQTAAALKTWRARQAEERLASGPAYDARGFVFNREDGNPLHPDWISRTFERRVRDTDLPRIRVHDLRHTWAWLALEAGVPAKVGQEILGHASVGITLDTYSHVVPAMREEAAATVAALIFPGEEVVR